MKVYPKVDKVSEFPVQTNKKKTETEKKVEGVYSAFTFDNVVTGVLLVGTTIGLGMIAINAKENPEALMFCVGLFGSLFLAASVV